MLGSSSARIAGLLVLVLGGAPLFTVALNNGIGVTPPMGWRHWKAFGAHISQDIMENMMDEMATKYPVDGVPTSLKQLGYLYVGLDDHWQNCTTVCPNGTVVPSWMPKLTASRTDYDYQSCTDASGINVPGSRSIPWYSDGTDPAMGEYGTPQVDMHRFPDMKAMVTKAHNLGLRAGWYMGNYQCSGANGQCNHGGKRGENCTQWDMDRLVAGSVKALVEYGFDSVKLDSGFGVGVNQTLWARLFNESGRPIMMENCHQGALGPGLVQDGRYTHNCTGLTPTSDCPFTFFRTTGDPEPGWGTIMRELNSLRKVVNIYYGSGKHANSREYNADPPRSRPGGWAYPGTMVVGDGGSVVNGTMKGGMTKDENRVHFGGWCIVSSPLILAYNLSEPARRELVWDIITNKEAIQVNQIWAGHPGSQKLAAQGTNKQVEVWTKPLGGGRTAVLIVNTADQNVAELELAAAQRGGSGGGPVKLEKCDASKGSQSWALDKGVTPGDSVTTNVQSSVGKFCWEITGCNTHPGAGVGTHYGCKSLPKPGSCKGNPCACNGAWMLNKNGTITSVMDGQCLQASGSSVNVGPCVAGSATQKFVVTPAKIPNTYNIKINGECVDDFSVPPPPKPKPPPCVPPSCTPGGPANITITLADLDLGIEGSVIKVRDVWNKQDLPNAAGTFSASVRHHGCVFVVFMPLTTKWPLPFKLAPWMDHPAPPSPP